MIGKFRRRAMIVVLSLTWSLMMSPALAACAANPSSPTPGPQGEATHRADPPEDHSGHRLSPWHTAPAVPRLSPGPAKPVIYLVARDRATSWLVPLTVAAGSLGAPGSTSNSGNDGPYPALQALKMLLSWPRNDFVNTPASPGLSIKNLTVKDRMATLDLSLGSSSSFEPARENLLIRSLVLTLTEDPSVDRVQILVDGKCVPTLFGQADISAPLSRPPFINLSGFGLGDKSNGAFLPEGSIPLVLWFGDPQATYMVPVTRYVPKTPGTVMAMLEQLRRPEAGLGRVLPDGTEVRGATVKDRTVTVDFSDELRRKHWGGTTGESQTINGIIYSLAGLPGIRKVNILIEGRPEQSIAGHVILEPRERGPVNQIRLEDLPYYRNLNQNDRSPPGPVAH